MKLIAPVSPSGAATTKRKTKTPGNCFHVCLKGFFIISLHSPDPTVGAYNVSPDPTVGAYNVSSDPTVVAYNFSPDPSVGAYNVSPDPSVGAYNFSPEHFCTYLDEELIRWGWPEDVWFHVDKLSSAHVYLRLHPGETIDDIPQAVIDDCVQLVKANSIQGNKQNNLDVVYTMWANLKKTASMDVGQVGFHKEKDVKKVRVEKRINEIVNRLNKTKTEEQPDFRALREERDKKEREDQRRLQQEQKLKEKEEEKRKQEQAEIRSYGTYMKSENMQSNRDYEGSDDDFM
uniref:Coiled-coil domain-containing protein 25 n=1 Tax=Biomphalaria glabrata TaxID=6526 RepID=A0A2C9LU60_BIOGL